MGKSFADAVREDMERGSDKRAAREKYPALRTIARYFYALSTIVIVLGVLDLVGSMAFAVIGRPGWYFSAVAVGQGVLALLVASSAALSLRAKAESILVLIDIEQNTRDAVRAAKSITE